MTITTATAPQDTNDIASRGFGALRRAQGLAPADTEAGGGTAATLHKPLAVYYLGADTLASDASTTQARQVGWRYLVRQADSVGSVEVLGNQVSSVTQGEVPAHLAQALVVAEGAVEKSRRYEARVLLFGRAGDTLLWLHARRGRDRFFSLGAEPKEVEEQVVMKSAATKAQLRQRLSELRSKARAPIAAEQDESGG